MVEIKRLTESLNQKYRINESVEPTLGSKVKEVYTRKFPDDDLAEDIYDDVEFADVILCLNNGGDFYDCIGAGDSVIRERVFDMIADMAGVDYDVVYDTWMGRGTIPVDTSGVRYDAWSAPGPGYEDSPYYVEPVDESCGKKRKGAKKGIKEEWIEPESYKDFMWEQVEEGLVDPKEMCFAFIKWMSEYELKDFVNTYDLNYIDESLNK